MLGGCLFSRMPKPSSSCSISFLWPRGFKTSSTIRIRLQVRATEKEREQWLEQSGHTSRQSVVACAIPTIVFLRLFLWHFTSYLIVIVVRRESQGRETDTWHTLHQLNHHGVPIPTNFKLLDITLQMHKLLWSTLPAMTCLPLPFPSLAPSMIPGRSSSLKRSRYGKKST